MDAGPILAQYRQALATNARAEPLLNELCTIGAELLLKVLPAYLRGEHELTAQDESQATYTGLVRKSDGMIDWHLPAQQIERMTRAYDPWPGATSTWQGQPIRVIDCNVGSALTGLQPGMLAVRDGNLWVACGSQALELVSIQPAGKRPMSGRDWLRGIRDIQSARLGNTDILKY
jgi:methionyl-tRNA formyltransferase